MHLKCCKNIGRNIRLCNEGIGQDIGEVLTVGIQT